MLKNLRSGVRRFARNKRGNVAILFGLSIIPILLGIGVAVDYGRALIVHERMSSAADAAALAIGSWTGLTHAELKTKAQQYFEANYPSDSLGAVGKLKVNFQGDDILVDVSASVPTTFMRLANIDSLDVGVSSMITKKQRNIELALVLDTTGSMGQGGKMSAMQSAAKKMVKDLFDGNDTSDSVKIGVVPFSAAVNIGTDKIDSGWLDKGTYPNMSSISKENFDFDNGQSIMGLFDELKKKKGSWAWDGCVRERAEPYELTDDSPVQGDKETLFTPYLAPDEPDSNNGGNSYDNSYIEDGNCGVSGGGGWGGWGGGWGGGNNATPQQCQTYTGKYFNPNKDSNSASPNDSCPPRAVTALTNNRGQVTSAIEQLQPNGNTVIPAGLLWGWRVLSPGAPFTEGQPYNNDKVVKAMVLLTDGENNVAGGLSMNGSAYSAFGYKSNGHLGSDPASELNDKTATVCSAIKAKGILVFTIGFQVYDSTTQNLLKNCATQPDMYYNSPSNSQLAAIFKDIAQGLSDLRIAQ